MLPFSCVSTYNTESWDHNLEKRDKQASICCGVHATQRLVYTLEIMCPY